MELKIRLCKLEICQQLVGLNLRNSTKTRIRNTTRRQEFWRPELERSCRAQSSAAEMQKQSAVPAPARQSTARIAIVWARRTPTQSACELVDSTRCGAAHCAHSDSAVSVSHAATTRQGGERVSMRKVSARNFGAAMTRCDDCAATAKTRIAG